MHSTADKYFTEIGSTLANKIDVASKHFHEYHNQTSQPENIVSVNELKHVFFSLVMTALGSMLSKSVSEFYTNLRCIFLIFLFKLGFFQMNLKLRVILLHLKEMKIGT